MAERLRLLMIEDSELDAELVRMELERGGFTLDWLRVQDEPTVRDALEDRPWDVILSDFTMPRFDGLQAFQIAHAMRPETPFIFVSGALGEDRAVAAMRAGARDYFLKSNLARLSEAVRRELDERRSRDARWAAEATARREQRRLAMAVEASGAGVYEYQLPADEHAYFSDRWNEILGAAPDPRQRLRPFDWLLGRVHDDDRRTFLGSYRDFIAGTAERWTAEARVRHSEGHWVEVATFAKAVVRDEEGQASHVVGVLLDLSERRSLEAQLRQAQRMEAVGRLAGGVAHDFNNLLTVIYSFGSMVAQSLDAGEPASRHMQEVMRAAERAEALTSQLLAFSRRKPLAPGVVSVNAVVADMERMLLRVVGEDVRLRTSLAPDLRNVWMDAGCLEQVVMNLCVNARDAMPSGGELWIQTANACLAGVEDAGLRGQPPAPGEYVELRIEDHGTGMDASTIDKIFDPFFTTKDPGRGTGLGLSTCYGIVEQAGGCICVDSVVGEGTTFRLYFPCTQETAEGKDRLATRLPPGGGSETILVAEDDEQVRQITVMALTAAGYAVIEAEDGAAALAEFEAQPGAIDLLVTDVVMPRMGGPELASAVARQRADVKVLYVSGHTTHPAVGRDSAELGPLLAKPFTPASLLSRVREVLDGAVVAGVG